MNPIIIKFLKKIIGVKILRQIYSILSKCVLRDNDIRHIGASIIYSRDDEESTSELIEIIADAAKLASKTY